MAAHRGGQRGPPPLAPPELLDLILLRERAVQRHVEAGPSPERTDLTEALDAIPRTYREVIVLHYYADLSVEEISAALGVPGGTVKSRLSRGRAALAQRLPGYSPLPSSPPSGVRHA